MDMRLPIATEPLRAIGPLDTESRREEEVMLVLVLMLIIEPKRDEPCTESSTPPIVYSFNCF